MGGEDLKVRWWLGCLEAAVGGKDLEGGLVVLDASKEPFYWCFGAGGKDLKALSTSKEPLAGASALVARISRYGR